MEWHRQSVYLLVSWSTTLIKTEIFQQLLDGFQVNLAELIVKFKVKENRRRFTHT